jgi:hypothetical protein
VAAHRRVPPVSGVFAAACHQPPLPVVHQCTDGPDLPAPESTRGHTGQLRTAAVFYSFLVSQAYPFTLKDRHI